MIRKKSGTLLAFAGYLVIRRLSQISSAVASRKQIGVQLLQSCAVADLDFKQCKAAVQHIKYHRISL